MKADDFKLQSHYSLDEVKALLDFLRSPEGCPWDQVQTHASLRKNLLEEAYEAVDAIDHQNDDHLAEELGDVLMQVFFHAGLAEDAGRFTLDDVTTRLGHKLYTRHSHVFGQDEVPDNPEAVLTLWEANKQKEKAGASQAPLSASEAVLRDMEALPKAFPPTLRAYKLQKKAATLGFDWEKGDIKGPAAKVQEELDEVLSAPLAMREEELGDLLFATINLARHLEVDPLLALEGACRKFQKRITAMVQASGGVELKTLSPEAREALWEAAKKRLLASSPDGDVK